ncbi:MAG: hypothetical protein LBK28_01120 [Propionibacteriaceae bacterium]|nr:hypothetical protein [Propionibacteriaceae bacterium]
MSDSPEHHQINEVQELRIALKVAKATRRAKAEALAGKYPAILEPGYLDDLRQEWDRRAGHREGLNAEAVLSFDTALLAAATANGYRTSDRHRG